MGWANLEEVDQMTSAGREWLDAFHFTTIPSRYTSHTISGLAPETSYFVIIGAQGARFGSQDLTWSEWSQPATTASQHGAGICPITGLPLPEGGYKSLGDTTTSDLQSFTLSTVIFPEHTALLEADLFIYPPGTSAPTYYPPTGRKWAKTCGQHTNHSDSNIIWAAGYDQNLATDTGIAFILSQQAGFIGGLYSTKPGKTRAVCQLWHIPDNAETLVVAVGLNIESADSYHLYSIDVE